MWEFTKTLLESVILRSKLLFLRVGTVSDYLSVSPRVTIYFWHADIENKLVITEKRNPVPLGGLDLNTGLSTKYLGDFSHGILPFRVLFVWSLTIRITMLTSDEYEFMHDQCCHLSRFGICILKPVRIKYWRILEFIFQTHKISEKKPNKLFCTSFTVFLFFHFVCFSLSLTCYWSVTL